MTNLSHVVAKHALLKNKQTFILSLFLNIRYFMTNLSFIAVKYVHFNSIAVMSSSTLIILLPYTFI